MTGLYFAYGSNLNLEDLRQYEGKSNVKNKNNAYLDTIRKAGGNEYVQIAESIISKEYTELEISTMIKLEIRKVQKILYDLSGKNLIQGQRVAKDGKFVYYWRADTDYNIESSDTGTFADKIKVLDGIYFLPDYELEFSVYSPTRRGGVLNVTPVIGHAVAGKLYEIDDWSLLDKKEGAPNFYKKIPIKVISESGQIIPAQTYVVNEIMRDGFQRPNPEYVSIIAKGYSDFEISKKYLWVLENLIKASENSNPKMIDRVFVYGTLRKGESRNEIMSEISTGMKDTTINAKMYDVGSFPAIILKEGQVFGELHTIRNSESIKTLDRIEGFAGYERKSLYLRILLHSKGDVFWTYVWNGNTDDLKEISSGDWKQYENSRKIMKQNDNHKKFNNPRET